MNSVKVSRFQWCDTLTLLSCEGLHTWSRHEPSSFYRYDSVNAAVPTAERQLHLAKTTRTTSTSACVVRENLLVCLTAFCAEAFEMIFPAPGPQFMLELLTMSGYVRLPPPGLALHVSLPDNLLRCGFD